MTLSNDLQVYRVEGCSEVIEHAERRICEILRSQGWSSTASEQAAAQIITYAVSRAYADWQDQEPS